jgi:hypothetical protein
MTWVLLFFFLVSLLLALFLAKAQPLTEDARNFMMALRKASDQELGSMLAEALRAQALFRECERALALRSEDDSLRWVQAALAQLRLRIQSIRQEASVRTLRREPVRLAHARSAATSVG